MRRLWMIALALALLATLSHAQQPTPSTDAPVPADQWSSKKIPPPKPLNSVEALFSEDARRRHINQGFCLVSLIVDTQGKPQNIHIIRCSDPSFAENSLKAAAQYRFKPAVTQDGKPVPVKIEVMIDYRLYGAGRDPSTPVLFAFSSPPGTLSLKPDEQGVYTFTKLTTPPAMITFSDEGYGEAAFLIDGKGACDIVLTISAKGKASDPQVIHCVKPVLDKPAVLSLLNSKYKPGQVNGKKVPIRASVHLEYGDIPPKS